MLMLLRATCFCCLMHVAPGQPAAVPACSFNCEDCPANVWYRTEEGVCTTRTKRKAGFHQLGPHCHSEALVRDPLSCAEARAQMLRLDEVGVKIDVNDTNVTMHGTEEEHHFEMIFTVEDGCWIRYRDLHTSVCFGQVHSLLALSTQLVALALAGLFAYCASPLAPQQTTRHKFEQGARALVVTAQVGWFRFLMARIFRFTQVVTNLWLPILTMLKYEPMLVWPAWLLLYYMPTLSGAGRAFLANPELVNAPNRCSVFGLDGTQEPAVGFYAYSALRPALFFAIFLLLAEAVAWILGEPVLQVAINKGIWYRIGMSNAWSRVLVTIICHICVYCTSFYMVAASLLVLWSSLKSGKGGSICGLQLDEDNSTRKRIDKLVDEIVDVLDARMVDSQRSDAEREQVKSVGVEPAAPFFIVWSLIVAAVDFASYVWSVATFLRRARYVLAAVIAASLWESIFLLMRRGHLLRAKEALLDTMSAGVQSLDFRALVSWDAGIAGVPALMCKIYGLPSTDARGIVPFALNLLFMITSTRAMAVFICEEIDMGVGVDDDAPYKTLRQSDSSSVSSSSPRNFESLATAWEQER